MLQLIHFYRLFLSAFLAPACRFHPSCSSYAEEAVLKKGATRGFFLAAARLAKCHPFHPGGFDPVE